MTMTTPRKCAYAKCQKVPGERFTPMGYCSPGCATSATQPWKASHQAQRENAGKKRAEQLEAIPKSALHRKGYVEGFHAARHNYHYRTFLARLLALISADVEPSAGRSGPR